MSRNQRRLTDYDRAIRAIDGNTVDEFLDTPSSVLRKRREELIKKLKYYRDFDHLEEYHAKFLEIQTKEKGIVPFKWKPAQRTLFNRYVYPKIQDDKPVRVYILKARQIGFSTLIEGIGSSLCNLFADQRGTVIAHDKDTAAKIFRMCKLYHKRLPQDFKPARKLSNRYELQFANPIEEDTLGLESSFTVNTANNIHNVGTTLNFVHLSEFARYEEVNSEAEQGLVALLQSVPRSGKSFIFIETTAYGEGIGKRFWDDDANGFQKLFVSWIADEDYTFSTPLDVSSLQYDADSRYGDEITAREQIINELEVWYPGEAQDEEWLKHESLCRLNWRRVYIDEQCFGKLDLFHQEYPLTADEAFRISGRCVFNTYVLNTRKQQVEGVISPGTYDFVPQIDKTTPFGYLQEEKTGNVKIFHPPQRDRFYWLGVDVGAGFADSDPSAIQVLDDLYNQCAVYGGRIDPDILGYLAACLGKYYNEGRIVPEANTYGIATINKLIKDLEYGNVYIRKKVNSVDGSITNEWGFYTSVRTRPILINKLRELSSTWVLKLNDLDTIHEMLNFIYLLKNNKIKMEAAPGMHDDKVMALGMAALDVQPYEEMKKEEGPPIGSIEWHVQQMDMETSNSMGNFGNVTGM